MKYLLDTNAVIYLIHQKAPLHSKVLKRKPETFGISGFTEAELRYAVEKSPEAYRLQNELAISLLLSAFTRIYHDESISYHYGKIKAHLKLHKLYEPKNEIDLFIAATALAHDLIVITANIKDFKNVPQLKIEDWSKS